MRIRYQREQGRLPYPRRILPVYVVVGPKKYVVRLIGIMPSWASH
jgi:hypothetical protein